MRKFLCFFLLCLGTTYTFAQDPSETRGPGAPSAQSPVPDCIQFKKYRDTLTGNLWTATGIPCSWAQPSPFLGIASDGAGGLTATGPVKASSLGAPTIAPPAYIVFGDSLSTTPNGSVNNQNNMYYNHLALDLNIATPPTDRAASGDEAEDTFWRVQSGDNPAPTATPSLYSLMIGTNDADQNGVGPSTWEANYKLFHTAVIAWLALPVKTAGSTAATTGTCANDTTFGAVTGKACTASGSTLTFSSFTTATGPTYIFYQAISSDAGTWTYAIDGGAATPVSTAPPISFTTLNAHTASMGVIRVTGLSAGSHSIVFAQTHSGTMSILALASVPAAIAASLPTVVVADVPNQLDGTKLATTQAFAADARADVSLLAGDGLNVILAPVNSTLQATTAVADMQNNLHPNDVGNLEVYRAFTYALRFVQANPTPALYNPASNGAYTITAATFTHTSSGATPLTQIANFQNGNGTSEVDIRSSGNTKWALNAYYYGNTVEWASGLFPGICTATNDYCLYSYNQSARVFNINSTTGAFTLSAARKGTFVCTAGGTITVANANELVTSDVIISLNTAGGTISTLPAIKTISTGVNFAVLCGASDTSTYNYTILN